MRLYVNRDSNSKGQALLACYTDCDKAVFYMLYDTDNDVTDIYSHNMFFCLKKKSKPYTGLCVCVCVLFGFYTTCVIGNTYDPYFIDKEANVSLD